MKGHVRRREDRGGDWQGRFKTVDPKTRKPRQKTAMFKRERDAENWLAAQIDPSENRAFGPIREP